MKALRLAALGLLLLLLAAAGSSLAEDDHAPSWLTEPPAPSPRPSLATNGRGRTVVEATIITPFRSADVGSQVAGIVESVCFEEGDRIEEGQLVLAISKDRYLLAAKKAEQRVRSLEVDQDFAKKEAEIARELFREQSASRQELLRAEKSLESFTFQLEEARIELQRARRDLDDCQVKAPFNGYMAKRFLQPYEAVKSLDKLFSIVDSEKVYAVAHVPQEMLDQFKKGARAKFLHPSGKQFDGVVERAGKLIDPKTRAKKVYLLIDNPHTSLEIGMTGALVLE
jgi:RND family efflux transporter MFP subunit